MERIKRQPESNTESGRTDRPHSADTDPFIRLPEVRRQLGMGTSKIYTEIAAGRLHPPIRISPRLVVWFQSWITQYQQDRLAEPDAFVSHGLPPAHPNYRP